MNDSKKIFVPQKVPNPAYPPLEAIGDVEANMEEGNIWPYEELLRRGPGHDYIYSLLTDNIDARFLETCAASTSRLKMVANMAAGVKNNEDPKTKPLLTVINTNPNLISGTTTSEAFWIVCATAPLIFEWIYL